jgi:hypothetical protein
MTELKWRHTKGLLAQGLGAHRVVALEPRYQSTSLGFMKMWGISGKTKEMLAFQKGICLME